MNALRFSLAFLSALAAGRLAADDFVDDLDQALTMSAFNDGFRARVSGALDLEGYDISQPPPGLIQTDGHRLFNPRLSLFLDAQLGEHFYVFATWRADRGFDPGSENAQTRLDEAAVRYTPWSDGRLSLQVGKFATVVGNWVERHDSWDNPFITGPMPYDYLIGVWGVEAPRNVATLLTWGGVGPDRADFPDDSRSLSIVWGPSYTTGASASGSSGVFDYAVEVKNASLSSRPGSWGPGDTNWQYPTVSGRIGCHPDESWEFGASASTGTYLDAVAASSIAPGYGLGNYREFIFGEDAAYAWHHFQLWAEAYEAAFEIPEVARPEVTGYYLEAKLKLTPQLFGALRWNQELFSSIQDGALGPMRWGRNAWRIDAGPGYRFTPHLQGKLQVSLEHDDDGPRATGGLVAAQTTLRF